MTTKPIQPQQYKYSQSKPSKVAANASTTNASPTKITLSEDKYAGHGDHWNILTDNISEDVPHWLKTSIDNAIIPSGLHTTLDKATMPNLLLACNELCHINQILSMQDGKPHSFINAYPCVNSPYGLSCKIDRIIEHTDTQEGVLRLVSEDGSVIYAFDQLYTINQSVYDASQFYFVNFSAWAYNITPSTKDEVVMVEDPEAIRYHRAFNDIVAKNNGELPKDLETQIKHWQPETDEQLAPIEINLGHMCAYLFGETLGQEDEAWCQGQVLGKQETTMHGIALTVFDVVILREPDADPFVVRMATPTTDAVSAIEVHDYIQANIWLQAAIYQENQSK